MLQLAILPLLGVLLFLWGRHTGRVEARLKLSNWIRFRLIENAHGQLNAGQVLMQLNDKLKEL